MASHSLLISLFSLIVGTLAKDRPIALIGTLLSEHTLIRNGTLLIIDGHIADIGRQVPIPSDAIVLNTHGIILPGLIDVHNHLVWNVLPRWKPVEEFGSRYDWQAKSIYKILMEAPRQGLKAAGLECEMQRYAEVKAISQGATSVIGSLRRPCNQGLARNLDDDQTLGKILYEVFPLEMTDGALTDVKHTLSANGTLFVHLAEGASNDGNTAREFSMFRARGFLQAGVSIIHGVALKENDFAAMAKTEVGLVWSPRSNIELYGETVNVQAALKHGVTMAIAPDWSPTGSEGVLSELNYAATWQSTLEEPIFNSSKLLNMATINAAKLARLDGRLGALKKGYLADLLVLQLTDGNTRDRDPFWMATHARPEEVMLVMIDGKAVYGDPELIKKLVPMNEIEPFSICGTAKSIVFPYASESSRVNFLETERRLDEELRRWGRTLAPLSECGH